MWACVPKKIGCLETADICQCHVMSSFISFCSIEIFFFLFLITFYVAYTSTTNIAKILPFYFYWFRNDCKLFFTCTHLIRRNKHNRSRKKGIVITQVSKTKSRHAYVKGRTTNVENNDLHTERKTHTQTHTQINTDRVKIKTIMVKPLGRSIGRLVYFPNEFHTERIGLSMFNEGKSFVLMPSSLTTILWVFYACETQSLFTLFFCLHRTTATRQVFTLKTYRKNPTCTQ